MWKIGKIKHTFGILQKGIKMITLNSNIKSEQYLKLIDYAFGRCDCFAVNIPLFNAEMPGGYSGTLNDFINQVRPYIISRFTSKNYLSMRSSYKRDIYIIDTSESVCKIVKSVGGIYRWIHPYYPEDISFLTSSSGKCWLETIAHEEECRIYRCTKADIDFLDKCGISYTRDDEDQYVPYLKSVEHITDKFSGILYDVESDWEKIVSEDKNALGINGVMYKHSVFSDNVNDLCIEIREVNALGNRSAEDYIKNSIEGLDSDADVFKITQRKILVDGIDAIEYSYRIYNTRLHKYVKHIDIFCSINETIVVIFSFAGSGQINERKFRLLIDSVEFTY